MTRMLPAKMAIRQRCAVILALLMKHWTCTHCSLMHSVFLKTPARAKCRCHTSYMTHAACIHGVVIQCRTTSPFSPAHRDVITSMRCRTKQFGREAKALRIKRQFPDQQAEIRSTSPAASLADPHRHTNILTYKIKKHSQLLRSKTRASTSLLLRQGHCCC